jgi:histidinol-phosphate aminotransferase
VVDRDAHGIKQALEREGILIRYYKTPRLRDHIRVSVGRPDQTDALIEVLGRL